MQPFEPGDIFLACTLLNVPDDDHAGEGRIWQYDKAMNFKGELWTKGGEHFVGGLEFGPDGLLWAFNDFAVIHVDPKTGRQLPLSDKFLPRCYRSASFDQQGNVYLGEHMKAEDAPGQPHRAAHDHQVPGYPGRGRAGLRLHLQVRARLGLVQVFKTETAPEMTGFKGVTHSSLHPSGKFITYATETGKRLMRYDVVNDRQMPDLVTYPGDDIFDRVWVIAVKYLPDGRLLITRGDYMEMLDENGEVLKSYPLETYGWSDIEICGGGRHCLVSNIWEGTVVKVDVETGEHLGLIDTGFKAPNRCLAGVAEYKG
jgi:hypothetical protein